MISHAERDLFSIQTRVIRLAMEIESDPTVDLASTAAELRDIDYDLSLVAAAYRKEKETS